MLQVVLVLTKLVPLATSLEMSPLSYAVGVGNIYASHIYSPRSTTFISTQFFFSHRHVLTSSSLTVTTYSNSVTLSSGLCVTTYSVSVTSSSGLCVTTNPICTFLFYNKT